MNYDTFMLSENQKTEIEKMINDGKNQQYINNTIKNMENNSLRYRQTNSKRIIDYTTLPTKRVSKTRFGEDCYQVLNTTQKIFIVGNRYYQYSPTEESGSFIDFFIKFEDYNSPESVVKMVCGNNFYNEIKQNHLQKVQKTIDKKYAIDKRKSIDLFENYPKELREEKVANFDITEELKTYQKNDEHIIKYLSGKRKIPREFVQNLIDKGLLGLDKNKNVVFFHLYNNKIVGGNKTGTTSKRFKSIVKSSVPDFGFSLEDTSVQKTGIVKKLIFFEGAIDLLSYISIYKDNNSKMKNTVFVAMAGKKEGVIANYIDIYRNNGLEEIVLATDNANDANEFDEKIKPKLEKRYKVSIEKTPVGKDFNDYLRNIFGEIIEEQIIEKNEASKKSLNIEYIESKKSIFDEYNWVFQYLLKYGQSQYPNEISENTLKSLKERKVSDLELKGKTTNFEITPNDKKIEFRDKMKEKQDKYLEIFHNVKKTDLRKLLTLKQFESTKNVCDYLVTIDFRPLFGMKDKPLQKDFECLYNGRGTKAWISQDSKSNKFLYFFMIDDVTYSLDIFDLMYIHFGLNIEHSSKVLIYKLLIFHSGRNFILDELEKYKKNLSFLEKIELFKKQYEKLYKYIKRYLPVLVRLQKLGIKYLINETYKIDNRAVFYASLSYIGEPINVKRQNVGKAINVLALLGFIQKVPRRQVPTFLQQKVDTLKKESNHANINFYTIANIDKEMLQQATDIVTTLSKLNIKNDGITFKRLLKIFGKEIAFSIYPEFLNEEKNKNLQNTKKAYTNIDDNLSDGYRLDIRSNDNTEDQELPF